MPRRLKYRKLEATLKRIDDRFEIYEDCGKGSHRVIYHPDIQGRAESFPLPFHGANTEINPGYISDIIQRFQLNKAVFWGDKKKPAKKA